MPSPPRAAAAAASTRTASTGAGAHANAAASRPSASLVNRAAPLILHQNRVRDAMRYLQTQTAPTTAAGPLTPAQRRRWQTAVLRRRGLDAATIEQVLDAHQLEQVRHAAQAALTASSAVPSAAAAAATTTPATLTAADRAQQRALQQVLAALRRRDLLHYLQQVLLATLGATALVAAVYAVVHRVARPAWQRAIDAVHAMYAARRRALAPLPQRVAAVRRLLLGDAAAVDAPEATTAAPADAAATAGPGEASAAGASSTARPASPPAARGGSPTDRGRAASPLGRHARDATSRPSPPPPPPPPPPTVAAALTQLHADCLEHLRLTHDYATQLHRRSVRAAAREQGLRDATRSCQRDLVGLMPTWPYASPAGLTSSSASAMASAMATEAASDSGPEFTSRAARLAHHRLLASNQLYLDARAELRSLKGQLLTAKHFAPVGRP
ncbi:hypothetical protein CXG81DRAFT_16928 [Caulochytrium protostelioides]|uniref:Uncharacterized protein n=1 Tax=Caulochytrium protostelioides TaxID=1555241 RepID=A0A4V1IVC2_9FUNG|nr:hypothetical protein CXG81DRAFT_16928 [Caulochytrium protostelioides]|eukprot:RKP03549.1 hypothetical protein CXG81DRAFT_16928 [Caulochytrium protostelioides]